MNSTLIQVFSLTGAALVLIAYAGQQFGHVATETRTYQMLNLLGGTCLFVAAVGTRTWGFIILEGSWALASAYGLWRIHQQRRI